MTEMTKWIDLKDRTGARLRLLRDTVNGVTKHHLVISGLQTDSPRWNRATELLNFKVAPSRKVLIRTVGEKEPIKPDMFRAVWPNASIATMNSADVLIPVRGQKADRKEITKEEAQDQKDIAIDVGRVTPLGRNADGEQVFLSPLGRYIDRPSGPVYQSDLLSPALFLRATDEKEGALCADGFVQAMLMGEVQRSEDFERFVRAVTDTEPPFEAERMDWAWSAIKAAVMRHLTESFDTPQDAYGDSARLYEYMPPFRGLARGKAAMPIPLSVMAQRLLGDTSNKLVAFPDAYDGATFSFLHYDTKILAFRGSKDMVRFARGSNADKATWGDNFDPLAYSVDAIFLNKDPAVNLDGQRTDFSESMRALKALKPGGRAVLALASDEYEQRGVIGSSSTGFYDYLSENFEVESFFEIPPQMTEHVGTSRPLRVVALRNTVPSAASSKINQFPVMNSWDEVKSYVDEAIIRINLKEVESESIDIERIADDNVFQRPYVAFSKVGEATTMVPKNLQASMQAALSELEFVEGPIDRFVERELQFGENTLGERFSPEQVDAIALSIRRIKNGRAPIIGDETGMGKGRQIAAIATWASKQGRPVIFVTYRANLFSDLARDMRDIEEWGRFNPMVVNSNTSIINMDTKEEIHPGTPTQTTKNIVENMVPLELTQHNLIFTTYSQFSNEDSIKGEWLINQAKDALVIFDEAHYAAGSDSNISRVTIDLATRAWGAVYSSATWAKSCENLHIYHRAMPEAINMGSLSTTMRTGGEAFAEVFSAMLARDGALIRREHDLSRLEFVVQSDTAHLARNTEIADKVAEVLGAMTYVGGEINRIVMRANNDTLSSLKRARSAHSQVVSAMRTNRAEARARAAALAEAQEALIEGDEPAEAAPVAPPDLGEVQIFRSSFGAGTVLYQVMRRLMALLNADFTAEKAIEAYHQDQRKPVIVFEDTGESFVKRIMEDLTIPAFENENAIVPESIPVPTIRDMLLRIASRMGVLEQRKMDGNALIDTNVPEEDDEAIDVENLLNLGSTASASYSLVDLPGLTENQKEEYAEGMRRIIELITNLPPLPLNAIDVVRARLAAADIRTGELSGRKLALDIPESLRNRPIESDWLAGGAEDNWKLTFRKKSKKSDAETIFAFNNGDLDALVINRSVAAGISLHSSPKFRDQRRRELFEMQIPENPTDRIQLYGRVNRYGQVNTPRISIMTSGVYGELRQLMMQNKKLAKLSANIRSSRENAAEIKHVVDLLNPIGEEVCLRYLKDNAPIRSRLGITAQEIENPNFMAASKLTSRLVLLLVAEQKVAYEELYANFEEEVIRLELAGKNPLKAKEMDVRAKTVMSRIAIGVDMEGYGSAFDGPVYIKKLQWTQNMRPIDWAEIRKRVMDSRQKLTTDGHAKFGSLKQTLVDLDSLPRYRYAEIYGREADQNEDHDGFAPEAGDAAVVTDVVEKEVSLPALKPLAAQMGEILGSKKPQELQAFYTQERTEDLISADDMEVILNGWAKSQDILAEIDMSPISNKLVSFLTEKARLAVVGTDLVDLEAAIAAEGDNSVKHAWAKKLWLEREFHNLQPGNLIGLTPVREKVSGQRTTAINTALFRDYGVIVALHSPPKGKEGILSKWKVEWVCPGDEKTRMVSLSTLMDDVFVVPITRENSTSLELGGGPYLEGFAFDSTAREEQYFSRKFTVRDAFFSAPRGQKTREGHVLEGNMYLASEWGQATGKGSGVIYTDENGTRHRAVMLNTSSYADRNMFDNLPIRLWTSSMLEDFAARLCSPDNEVPSNFHGGSFIFATDFASAMNESQANDKSKFLIIPNKGVALTVERKEMLRASRFLRSEVKRQLAEAHPFLATYSPEQKEEAKGSVLKVTTNSKRGSQPLVLVEADTPEKMAEAIRLISKAIGLEVYIWPASRAGQLAKEVAEDYFLQVREAARARANEQLASRNIPLAPVEAVVAEAPNDQEPYQEPIRQAA